MNEETTHKRKRRVLTDAQKRKVLDRYDWKCACGCGALIAAFHRGTDSAKPRFKAIETGEAVEFDHIHSRWINGTERPDNFRPLIVSHHLDKTKIETRDRAHIKRITGETGSRKRENARKRKEARLVRELEKVRRA